MSAILHNAWFQAAVGGLLSAAAIDIHSFLSSPNWKVDGFNWSTATKRWFTGVVSVLLTKAGFGTLIG